MLPLASMPNISIPKGQSVYLPFTVFGPGGPNASPPDVDTTTVVTSGAIGVTGASEIAAQLVTSDGPTTRRLRVDALATASVGAGRADIAVTARNRTSHQIVDIAVPPDLSAVQFGPATGAFPTPAPGDPVQFP